VSMASIRTLVFVPPITMVCSVKARCNSVPHLHACEVNATKLKLPSIAPVLWDMAESRVLLLALPHANLAIPAVLVMYVAMQRCSSEVNVSINVVNRMPWPIHMRCNLLRPNRVWLVAFGLALLPKMGIISILLILLPKFVNY